MEGKEIIVTRTFKVKVLGTGIEIPNQHKKDFEEWLQSQVSYCGVGKHHEYYSFEDDFKTDISVTFEISTI